MMAGRWAINWRDAGEGAVDVRGVCFRSLTQQACVSNSVGLGIGPCFVPSTFAAAVLVEARQEQDTAKASTNGMQEVRACLQQSVACR